MKLESQVTSLDLAKRLDELNVKQESAFYWCEYTYYNDERMLSTEWILKDKKQQIREIGLCFPAFTVAELGEMLPHDERFILMNFENGHCQMFMDLGLNPTDKGTYFEASTEADARAKMLIYLLENHLLDTTK